MLEAAYKDIFEQDEITYRLPILRSEINIIRRDIEALKDGVTELRQDVNSIKSTVADTRSDNRVLQNDVSALKADVRDMRSEISNLKSDVRTLGARLDSVDRRIDDYTNLIQSGLLCSVCLSQLSPSSLLLFSTSSESRQACIMVNYTSLNFLCIILTLSQYLNRFHHFWILRIFFYQVNFKYCT